VSPHYPDELRRTRTPGRVVTNYTVDTAGHVLPSSIAILFASRPGFATAICEALKRAQYPPLVIDGQHRPFRIVQGTFEFGIRIIRRPDPHGSA